MVYSGPANSDTFLGEHFCLCPCPSSSDISLESLWSSNSSNEHKNIKKHTSRPHNKWANIKERQIKAMTVTFQKLWIKKKLYVFEDHSWLHLHIKHLWALIYHRIFSAKLGSSLVRATFDVLFHHNLKQTSKKQGCFTSCWSVCLFSTCSIFFRRDNNCWS